MMQRRLIEALTYPRMQILKNIELKDCPHEKLFEASSERCHNCDLQQECHWLRCINDFADFASWPTHTIHASLLYSIKLVQADSERMQHKSKKCNCQSCSWTRSAQELTQEYQTTHPVRMYG